MNGTILHFDAAEGGVIRGGDGNRYAFAAAEWKSEAPPAPGGAVDFEIDGDAARSVYGVPAAVAAPAGPASRPGLFFADRPGLPFAVAILIACFLPFISMGFVSVNLFDLVSLANMMGNFTPGIGSMQTGLWLFYFLYAVPIVAIWVGVQELRRAASGGLRFGGGLFCLAGPFAIVIGATALMKAGLPGRHGAGEFNLNLISGMSVGWILIAIAAAGLIAVGLGWRPFGEDSDDRAKDAF